MDSQVDDLASVLEGYVPQTTQLPGPKECIQVRILIASPLILLRAWVAWETTLKQRELNCQTC